MKFQMRCPHCNSVMEAEEEWIGQSAQCPVCNTEIVIQKPDPPAPRLTPVSAGPAINPPDVALPVAGLVFRLFLTGCKNSMSAASRQRL